jgi:Ion transport protein.
MAKVEDISTATYRQPPKRTILPTSLIFQSWEGVVALACLLSTIFVTFQIAIKENVPGLTEVVHAIDFIYLIHIIVKFHVGYIQKGTLIIDLKRIRQKYLRGMFLFDVISCILIPLDFICYMDGIDEDFKRIVRVLKILKILRFYTLTSYFGKSSGGCFSSPFILFNHIILI